MLIICFDGTCKQQGVSVCVCLYVTTLAGLIVDASLLSKLSNL